MKVIQKVSCYISAGMLIVFLIPMTSFSQPKRQKPPKRHSKIKSVDQFVDHTFELYYNIFVYDSLTQAGVEVPSEIEDALIDRAEKDIDSLWQVLPTVLDDMSSGSANIIKKGKATINLNKAKKALKYCMQAVKTYFVGNEEEEDDDGNK